MSIKTGTPPDGAFQIVSDVINKMAGSPVAAQMSLTDPASCRIETPLEVYVMGLNDVSSDGLARARQIGWRYTVSREGQPLVTVEVNSAGGENIQFSHVNKGQFVEATVAAMRQAEELETAADNDYEARLLEIPPLYVVALWLHGDSEDILIPMPPEFTHLTSGKPYSEEEFFEILIPAAEARKAVPDPA